MGEAKRTYDYEQSDSYNGVPMSLRMQPELCERLVRDLRQALENLRDIKEEFGQINLDSSLGIRISGFKSKLNKYVLVGCDCSWSRVDSELNQALTRIDMCYGILMNKSKYTVSDICYVSRTLDEIKKVFEEKLELFEELVRGV